MPPLRTRIYIDGYNFYYGCLKGTPHKWLDIPTLFEQQILPTILYKSGADELPAEMQLSDLAIKYFTAGILEKAAKANDSVSSQARYHEALTRLYRGRLEIINGYYSLIESKAKMIDPEDPEKWPRECENEVMVWKLEEKQSDVNLSLHAYHDAMTGVVDQVVIVTNDTDIAPALDMIRQHTDVVVGLVIPTTNHKRRPNSDLKKHSHWVRKHITMEELAASQLPRAVLGGRKPTLKPVSWYARPDLLEQVLEAAKPVVETDKKAFKWLDKPNLHLDNQCPIDLIETDEGAARVLKYIEEFRAT